MHFKLKSDRDRMSECACSVSYFQFSGIKKGNNVWSGSFENFKIIVFFAFTFICCYLNIPELLAQKPVLPDINASVSGSITCINTTVKLNGSSKTPGAYFTWNGPGGYYSTAPSAVTAMPGEYTLTVKDAVNGTTATAIVKVLVDTIAPKGLSASVSGILTCKDTLVTLAGNSSTSGVTYDWQGPKNYTSAIKNPVTAMPGIYLLKITNPVNGCSSFTKVGVEQNITPPSGVLANVSDVLTCKNISVTLTGMSATKGVKYFWLGKGFKSETNKTVVSNPGSYLLTVIDPVNGCESNAKINVEQDITPPTDVLTEVSDTLNCKTEQVTIKVISSGNAAYSWSGPNNLKSTDPSFTVSLPGIYKVTVTNHANGCSIIKPVTVLQDTASPVANIFPSGDITCKNKSVVLKDSKNIKKYAYNWSGPENFTSALTAPEVKLPGTYYATVTNTINGCSAKKSISIKQNISAPDNVSAKASGTISCAQPKVTLSAFSSSRNVLFNWVGPKGFTSDKKSAVTTYPGSYTLEVIDPVNGCKSQASISVNGEECSKNKN